MNFTTLRPMLATVFALLLLHTSNATTAPTQQRYRISLPSAPAPTQQPTAARPPRKPAAAGHLVYLCGGSRSFAYHAAPDCEGLAWCTTELRKATVAAATKQGRYPCGRCRPAR